MKGKALIFGLIAAAVSGVAGDLCEKGLFAADEKLQKRKALKLGDLPEDPDDITMEAEEEPSE